MITRETYFRRLFRRHLPPWASRIGYPPSVVNYSAALPASLLGLPLMEAPHYSLHGLFVDYEDSPDDVAGLLDLLKKLLPGGTALLFLKRSQWSIRRVRQICQGIGVTVDFCSPTLFLLAPLTFIYRLFTGRMLVPRFFLWRMLQRLEEAFFPYLRLPFGAGIFAVIRNDIYPVNERSTEFLTILIPVEEENPEGLQEKLADWHNFLKNNNLLGRTEIIVINDDLVFSDEVAEIRKLKGEKRLFEIQHYRKFGVGRSIRSGMTFATGRYILVDESDGTAAPEELWALLGPFLREEIARSPDNAKNRSPSPPIKKPVSLVLGLYPDDHPSAADLSRRQNRPAGFFRLIGLRIRRTLYRLAAGNRAPISELRLHSIRAVRKIVGDTVKDGRLHRTEAAQSVARGGMGIVCVPINPKMEPTRGRGATLSSLFLFRLAPILKALFIAIAATALFSTVVLFQPAPSPNSEALLLARFLPESGIPDYWWNQAATTLTIAHRFFLRPIFAAFLFLLLPAFPEYLATARFLFDRQGRFLLFTVGAFVRNTFVFSAAFALLQLFEVCRLTPVDLLAAIPVTAFDAFPIGLFVELLPGHCPAPPLLLAGGAPLLILVFFSFNHLLARISFPQKR